MKKIILTLAIALVASGVFAQDAGIVSRPSKFSVAETADRLESAITRQSSNLVRDRRYPSNSAINRTLIRRVRE